MTAIILAAGQALRRARITAILMDACDAFRRSSDTKNPSPLWVLSVSTFLSPKSLLIVRSTWTTIVGASICTGWLKPVCPIPCQRVDIGAGGGYWAAVLAFLREEGRGDRLFWHPVKSNVRNGNNVKASRARGEMTLRVQRRWGRSGGHRRWRSSGQSDCLGEQFRHRRDRGIGAARWPLCAAQQEVRVEVMRA